VEPNSGLCVCPVWVTYLGKLFPLMCRAWSTHADTRSSHIPLPSGVSLIPLVQVAFSVDAIAAAAVQSTRAPLDTAAHTAMPLRDILILHPTGRLSLYIGSRHVCNVAVCPEPDAAGPDPYAALARGTLRPTKLGALASETAARSSVECLLNAFSNFEI